MTNDMTTIYKTTYDGGRREICALPLTAEETIRVIKWVFNRMGYGWVSHNPKEVEVSLKGWSGLKETVIYDIEEKYVPLPNENER